MKTAFSNRALLLALPVGMAAVASTADAATMAYWRFEGTADTDVTHIAGAGNTYSDDVLDVSGNGNNLSAWETGGGPGEIYRASIPGATTAAGLSNGTSIQKTPAMFQACGTNR